MAIQILSMPEMHPLRVRCPDSYPPGYSTDRDDDNNQFCPWHEPEPEDKSTRYQTRLDRILASINQFIQPTDNVETFNACDIPPWNTHDIDITVSSESKEEEAGSHEALFERIYRDPGQVLLYTDGSMLEEHVGAGVTLIQARNPPVNHAQYLGTQMEVYDAEMWVI